MSFLTDFFNNFKNRFTHKNTLPPPGSIKVNTFSDVQEEEENFVNSAIDELPSALSVHTNIAAKQSMEMSFLLDMAYIAATADDGFYLPRPYKIHHSGKDAKFYEEKYNADVAFTDEYFKTTIETNNKLDAHSKPRMKLLEEIRTIYPDFFHDMNEKIPEEDYTFYRKNKAQLKKCLSASEVAYSDKKFSKDLLLTYRDNLAKLIDSLDFSKACRIEDSFVIDEFNIFFQKLSELSPEEQLEFSNRQITIKEGETMSTLDFALKLQHDRESRIEKYSTIESLYNKLENQSKLKLNIREINDENTNHIRPYDLVNDDEIR